MQVRAFDQAGNVSEAVPLTFQVDGTPPSIRLTDAWYIWETGEVKVSDEQSGLAGVEIQIRDGQGRWQKVVRAYEANGDSFVTTIAWDRRFGDGTLAPIGSYEVLVTARDLAGNTAQETAHILIPPPNVTPTPLPTRTPLPTFTATTETSRVTADAPTITPTRTPIVAAFGGTMVQSVNSPISQSQNEPPSNVLWGATAGAAIAAATAYALEQRRKRKEEEARQVAEAAHKAAVRNAAEAAQRVQNWLIGQQIKRMQEAQHRAMDAKIARMEEAEGAALAAAKSAKPQRDEQAYQRYRQGERSGPQPQSSTPTPASTPVPMCTVPPRPQTFIGPAPTPTPTSTPMPTLSAVDVAHGVCEAADALDPMMPDPATVGGPDVGDIIDQAYIAQQNIPYGSAHPLFEALIRVPVITAKVFKDGPSTIVNFVCQQRDKSGPYYDLFPIDQKMQAVKNWWRTIDTKQKALVIGVAILALLIAIPLFIK